MAEMKEIVVLSGKGGTGKTLVCASFAALAGRVVLVDADVEAPNLRLIVGTEKPKEEHIYKGGEVARVDGQLCTGCGGCVEACRFGAVSLNGRAVVDPLLCEGCAACFYACPHGAVVMEERASGRWWVADCRYGVIVHGRLEVGVGLSGKLVSEMKQQARRLEGEYTLRLVDGPPGIGCPVIASLTGADLAVIVAEPTLSGLHDAQRVAQLAGRFGIKTALCVNKADLNPQMSARIRRWAESASVVWLGELMFDEWAHLAMVEGVSPVERGGALAEAVKAVWTRIRALI